jgi:hypothetical protein
MPRVRRRGLMILIATAACLFSGGTSSSLARFTSTGTAGADFTTGYWDCTAGSAVLSTANGSTVQDTYVDQKNPNASYATADPLVVSSTPGASAKEKRMLLQFSPLPAIPPACTFKTATLTVWTSVAAAGLTYDIYNLAAAWTDTVTWNTPPPGTTGAPVTVATSGATGSTTWIVSALVSAQYAGNFNHGFVVLDPVLGTNNSTSYTSNEGAAAQRPTLTITWGP